MWRITETQKVKGFGQGAEPEFRLLGALKQTCTAETPADLGLNPASVTEFRQAASLPRTRVSLWRQDFQFRTVSKRINCVAAVPGARQPEL